MRQPTKNPDAQMTRIEFNQEDIAADMSKIVDGMMDKLRRDGKHSIVLTDLDQRATRMDCYVGDGPALEGPDCYEHALAMVVRILMQVGTGFQQYVSHDLADKIGPPMIELSEVLVLYRRAIATIKSRKGVDKVTDSNPQSESEV